MVDGNGTGSQPGGIPQGEFEDFRGNWTHRLAESTAILLFLADDDDDEDDD